MKKVKFLGLMLAMLIASVSFVGCSEDDDDGFSSISLSGTRWSYTVYGASTDNYVEQAITFSSTNTAMHSVKSVSKASGTTIETSDYTYSLSGNTVVLLPKQSDKATLEGTITDNIKMTIRNVSTNVELSYPFYKEK